MEEGRGPALLWVLKPNKKIVHPEDYLKAAGELLFLLFVIVWGMTFVLTPEVIESNPLKDRLGYNNLCVGFDAPPATYVGLLLATLIVYLGIRFAWTDLERSTLIRSRLSATRYYFSVGTDILYIVSISAFTLVFVISPFVSVWVHTLLFIQLIVVRFLVVWANVIERPDPAASSIRFLWVYGAISLAFPVLLIANYVSYDARGIGSGPAAPLIPHQISMAVDYLWFGCLALTTKFVPRGEGLRMETSLIPTS